MEVKTAVIALTALAQESRLRIFRLLVQAGETGLAAGEIAEELDIPSATLTFHLKELSHAGLIESQREGRSIRYALRIEGIRDCSTIPCTIAARAGRSCAAQVNRTEKQAASQEMKSPDPAISGAGARQQELGGKIIAPSSMRPKAQR